MSVVQAINSVAYPFLFSLSAFFMLIFFYKAVRHPNKSYGLLMIVILISPVFLSGVIELIFKFGIYNKALKTLYDTLDKFATLWMIFLVICHYFILKSFKGRYRKHPFGLYIALAVILCLAIAGISSTKFLDKKGINILWKDALALLILGLISFRTYRFRDEIKFGPYSVARAPASKLLKFSLIQAFFAVLYTIQDALEILNHCLDNDNSQSEESELCSMLNLSDLVVYECWVWFAVFSNWRMFALDKETEDIRSQETLLRYPGHSTFASNIECL